MLLATDADPLDIPVLRGPQRRRRADPRFKQGVADFMRQNRATRSTVAALSVVKRFKRFAMCLRPRSLDKLDLVTAKRYLQGVVSLAKAHKPTVLHLSWDATRLGGRETVWMVVCSPYWPCPVWLPPQVLGGVLRGGFRARRKRTGRRRLKATIFD